METYKNIIKRRSIRKFKQKKIRKKILFDCLNAARLAPSVANLQPLEYILVSKNLDKIFQHIKWARYLDDGTPGRNERPVAYIIVISNSELNKEAKYDVGLAVENIILTASEKGVASCVVGPVNREELAEILNIPKNYMVELIVTLGYPGQKSFEDKITKDLKYWTDAEGNLHVPKRKLKDIAHEEKF